MRRLRRFVSDDVAADLHQEVFECVVRNFSKLDRNTSGVAWVYQIATRICLHHLRDTQNRKRLLATWGAPAWSRPSLVASPDTQAFLNQVWRLLDEDLAEIGTYHYVDGLSQAEIAQVIGCSRRTVGNRLQALQVRISIAATPSQEGI